MEIETARSFFGFLVFGFQFCGCVFITWQPQRRRRWRCNSATATVQQQQQQMFCSFLAISIEKQSRQTLQKVIKCVTACYWSCKFLHAGQKGRQLLPAAAAVDCCNLAQCCTRPSTASDMQLSTSIQLSTVTTERQRPRSPLNAAKITQSRGPNTSDGPTGNSLQQQQLQLQQQQQLQHLGKLQITFTECRTELWGALRGRLPSAAKRLWPVPQLSLPVV